MSKSRLSTLALFFIAIIWGGAYLGVQSAIDSGWETMPLLFVRGMLGGSTVLLFALKKNWKNKKLFIDGIISGTFFFLGFAFQTFSQQISPISNIAFLTALNIIFVPLIEMVIYRRKVKPQLIIASVIAFIGVGFLSFNGSFAFKWADLLGILCAISFAFQIVYIKRIGHNHDPLQLTVVQLYTMGCLSLIGMLLANQTYFTLNGIEGVLYASLLSSALASVIQISAQKHVSSSKAGIIMGMEALFATVFAVLLQYESVTSNLVIGGLLMLISIFVTEFNFKKQRNSQ